VRAEAVLVERAAHAHVGALDCKAGPLPPLM
jgi:hypothetical protein